ncbi:MAG: carbamoyltransferase C-terminal domain-containing protein [Candidatus Diapherotrites archaeon]
MKYLLGITSPASANPAAALLKDGMLVAAVEEERFSRIKHMGKDTYPKEAIEWCLASQGITLAQVERIAVGWNDATEHLLKELKMMALNPQGFTGIGSALFYYNKIRKDIFSQQNRQKMSFYAHPLAHSASSYFPSGFEEANNLSLDNRGESEATLLSVGKSQSEISALKSFSHLNSLGNLYASFTEFLGFWPNSDEGKTMGLASYGKPVYFYDDVIKFGKGSYTTRRASYSNYFSPAEYARLMRRAAKKIALKLGMQGLHERLERQVQRDALLVKKFGKKRQKDEKLTQRHADIAATIQAIYETALVTLAAWMHEKNGIRAFTIAGGCGLNCVGNGKLLEQEFVDDIFIQPAATDAGTAIGAALLEHIKQGGRNEWKMDHAYYGPEFGNAQIEAELKKSGLKYSAEKAIEGRAAELIAKGKIIGWFQGKMEMGPRALGSRSILADPTVFGMNDKVNNQVKHREAWRPFCPSMLAGAAKEYLENPYPSPFMILSSRVKKEKWNEIPAVVHVDGTARSQMVEKKVNPRYYRLIEEFEKIKGVPVVMNTSFNDRGEPIVCTPADAVKTFRTTNLDFMAIGDYLVRQK